MSWTVDSPLRIGDRTLAAIVEFKVLVRSTGPAIGGFARKKPLVILQLRDGDVTGIDTNGHGYAEDEIELLYPGAIARVRAMLAEMENAG